MKKLFNKSHLEDAQTTTDPNAETDEKLILSIAGLEAELTIPDEGWGSKKHGIWF
jgi:hypothetical protein